MLDNPYSQDELLELEKIRIDERRKVILYISFLVFNLMTLIILIVSINKNEEKKSNSKRFFKKK